MKMKNKKSKKFNKKINKKIKQTKKRIYKLIGKGSAFSNFLNKKEYIIKFGEDYNEEEDEDLIKLYMISESIEDLNKPDLVLMDGKYYGETKDGERNGEGVMKYTDGNEYIGFWENNLRSGKGVMIWMDNPNYVHNTDPFITEPKIYIGEFTNNQINGKGKLKYRNGFTYIGNFENGMKNGYGLYFNRKFHFIGDWENNEFKEGYFYDRIQLVNENGIPVYYTRAYYVKNGTMRDAIFETNIVFDVDRIEYRI
jgi:hypothetical protein